MIIQSLIALGGIGLFLLGMSILTEGLRSLTGRRLRNWLGTLTTSPTSGAIAGAATTAIIQSSSATTVMAVGFVGAGLLTFSQALGIIFGANIGTTITGWMVAIVGFKLDLGLFASPLLFLGVLLKLVGSDRWSKIGWALAGFSLLFLGISATQSGLSGFEGAVTPDDFPPDTLTGRLLILLIGVVITIVTQSSSAGVATALVALHAGTLSFPQAAALVIGMDIGTTFKAALATIGGTAAMRQTGFAHVIYNFLTGIMAFFLLGPYAAVVGGWVALSPENAQIGLVGFHTLFNGLGVIVILPFAGPFARLIQTILPDRDPVLVRLLDRRLLSDPNAASEAALVTVRNIAQAEADLLRRQLTNRTDRSAAERERADLQRAIGRTREYLDAMRTSPDIKPAMLQHVAALHGLDHLQRLHHRGGQHDRIEQLSGEPRLARLAAVFSGALAGFTENFNLARDENRFERLKDMFRQQRRTHGAFMIESGVQKGHELETVVARLDALRWLHRTSYHFWRILAHLDKAAVTPLQAGAIGGNTAPPADTAVG
ncbi:MAG: Na/Pi symporter [Alphaproteobacteria bacterium]